MDKDDYARMAELYPTVGPQVAIRNLVHVHVQQVNAKRISETEKLVSELNLEVDD